MRVYVCITVSPLAISARTRNLGGAAVAPWSPQIIGDPWAESRPRKVEGSKAQDLRKPSAALAVVAPCLLDFNP